jgi:hypothetical protein
MLEFTQLVKGAYKSSRYAGARYFFVKEAKASREINAGVRAGRDGDTSCVGFDISGADDDVRGRFLNTLFRQAEERYGE